ncbi:MAG: sugar transferase [Acidobacteriia bacterium]|nr:sugar transferase [Terriglobia bacterium]
MSWGRDYVNRVFDIMLSASVLLLLAPTIAAIAAIIKMTSEGPVLSRQKVIGLSGAPFFYFRFRTFSTDSGSSILGNRTKTKLTTFGIFLHNTALEEVPVLWNVLRGEMTIVGISRELPVTERRQEARNSSLKKVSGPPGLLIQSFAEFLCSKKTYEQIVKPMIADLQFEYFEALSQRRILKASWIRMRYFFSLCSALGLFRVIRAIADFWQQANM